MGKHGEDSVPLQPLNDVIRKFKRRREIMEWLMVISMPSALMGIVLFALFALISNSAVSLATFILLIVSASASYIAILYIPGTLTDVIRSLEYTVRGISFTLMSPIGNSPIERIFNQLSRSDDRIKKMTEKNPHSVNFNIKVKGKSGVEHHFDLYLHSRKKGFLGSLSSASIFVRRFDESTPVSIEKIRSLKSDISDCVSSLGKRFPNRVLAISTSGFDDSVFEYVRSREGSFAPKLGPARCRIEMIQEKDDGNFDILSL